MGANIHIFAEIKKADKWERLTEKIFPDGGRKNDAPFDWRSYGMFGFLANVRNYSSIPPLGELKGLPYDSEYLNTKLEKPSSFNYGYFDNGTAYTRKEEIEKDVDYYSKTFYTLKELIEFDYDKTFEYLRYTEVTKMPNGGVFSNGADIAEKGKGKIITFREFLGESFFECIEIMKTLGEPENVRIVFWFGN
jgi:hypothetical protein